MHDILTLDHLVQGNSRGRPDRFAQIFRQAGGNPHRRHDMKALAVERVENAKLGLTQAYCLLENNLEHRRQIAGRGIDHLQHLGGRGLLLQCLALLGQQPRILDRDDRLIGEGADKIDLPIGKRSNPLAREQDDADHFAFA